ncbi:MAG: glycosyltransferase family 4 protein, partial [Acidobacteriota bacterium]
MRLFVCTPTHALQGGVERILESLARLLPARGIEVIFGLARGARFHDPVRFREAFPVVRGIDVDGTSGTAFGRRRALRRAITEIDPDVVLIARMFDAYHAAAELKSRGHSLRLAVTVQAYESDYFADLSRYAKFVDLVVTSGELIARAVRSLTPAGEVISIPGGVAPAYTARTLGNGPLRIGYVGRLEQVQKRVLDLPLLVDELERRGVPFTFEIAGDGSAAAELKARMPRARFHGWLSTAELYAHVYPALDVLVHVAEWEGVTIAPREAMVHGVVPVVSRFTGAEDFLDGVNALTFPVGDVAAAASAIERLDRDRELVARLSSAARTSQQGIRSEEGAADAWAAAFRRAVARPARVGSVLPATTRDTGRLTRVRAPDAFAELVRRIRRRMHSDPGSEWPHWSGIADPELARALEELA